MSELTDKEIMGLLLYFVEDLKLMVFHGREFKGYQLPFLNSMVKTIETVSQTKTMTKEEFEKVIFNLEENTIRSR